MAHTARSQYRNSQYGRTPSATEPTPNLIMSSTAPRVLWVTTASCYDKNCMAKPEWAADLPSTTNSPRQRLRQRFDRYWKVACWSHTVESLTFSAGLSSLLRGGNGRDGPINKETSFAHSRRRASPKQSKPVYYFHVRDTCLHLSYTTGATTTRGLPQHRVSPLDSVFNRLVCFPRRMPIGNPRTE